MITSSKYPGKNSENLTAIVKDDLALRVGEKYGPLNVLVRDCNWVYDDSIHARKRIEIYIECRGETECVAMEIRRDIYNPERLVSELATFLEAAEQHLAHKHCKHEMVMPDGFDPEDPKIKPVLLRLKKCLKCGLSAQDVIEHKANKVLNK